MTIPWVLRMSYIDFLQTILIRYREKRLWESMKRSQFYQALSTNFKNKENVWSGAWRVKTGLELSGLQTIQSRFLSTFTVEKTNKQATNNNPKNLKFTSWGVKKTATTTTTMFNKTNQKQKAAEKYLSPVTIVGTQYRRWGGGGGKVGWVHLSGLNLFPPNIGGGAGGGGMSST